MRRAGLAAAVLAVTALTGCGHHGTGPAVVTGATTTASAAPAGGSGTTLGPSGSTSTSSGEGSPPGSPPGSGGPPATPPATSADPDAAVRAAAAGPVGGLSPYLLRPDLTDAIVVEVFEQSGAVPRSASMDHMTGVLRTVSGKTVTPTAPVGVDGGAQAWTAASIVAAAGATTHRQGRSQAVIHLLFLHGTFEGDESVLGISVRGDVAAVFVDSVDSAATLSIKAPAIEEAVVTHEVGHLLGLVDLYLHTGRQDPQHPGHSTNPNSVMYWAVESNLVADLLTGGPPHDFDSDDLADLAAIRAGA